MTEANALVLMVLTPLFIAAIVWCLATIL